MTPDDEGGYFTWTDEDFRKALNDEEYSMLSLHLMHEAGSMHHDRSKKVLFTVMGAKEVAEKMGADIADVIRVINSGKEKRISQYSKPCTAKSTSKRDCIFREGIKWYRPQEA